MSWRVTPARTDDGDTSGWFVTRDADNSIISYHPDLADAERQVTTLELGVRTAALELEESESRCVGQLQSLYGNARDQWAVVLTSIGRAPPETVGELPYLGEPCELIHRLHQYRLRLARSAATAAHIRRTLAGELDLPASVLDTYLSSGSNLALTNAGWVNMARAVLFMRAGAHAAAAPVGALASPR